VADGGAPASPRQILLGTPRSGVRGPLDWPPSMAHVRDLRRRIRRLRRAGKTTQAESIRKVLAARSVRERRP
jgi:hypothetical protein